jgi:cytochrome o ubiquinol oxidase subunit IV
MHGDLSLREIKKEWHGSLRSYLIGFAISIVLTIASFSLVAANLLAGAALPYTLVVLALAQAAIQLRFFLHVGQEAKPRWELTAFYFMVMVLLIIALGSLWIMHDLNDRVMSNMTMGMPHD